MFMTNYELIYGKYKGISSSSPSLINAAEVSDEPVKEKRKGMENAAKAAKVVVGANVAAAKLAGGAISKLSRKAVDYAKSDDAAEKLDSAKEKAGAAFAGAKGKAAAFVAEYKKHRSDEAPAGDIPGMAEYAAEQAQELPERARPDKPASVSNWTAGPAAERAPAQSQTPYTPQASAPYTYSYAQQPEKKSPIIFILIGVIAVLLLAVGILGGMFFMQGRNNKAVNELLTAKKSDESNAEDSTEKTMEIVSAVISNENTWLNSLNEQADGFNECWFQDIDMDGTPEFIVGGQAEGAHGGVQFNIYSYSNGNLVPMNVEYSPDTGRNTLGFWGTGSIGGHDGFVCNLYKNNADDSFVYVYTSISGTGDQSDYSINEIKKTSDSTLRSENIITIGHTSDAYIYQPQYNDNYEKISSLTKEELLVKYDNYFSPLTLYETNIKPIPCTKLSAGRSGYYDSMTDDEKRTALLESYNAWSYNETVQTKLPLFDIISSIRNQNDETQAFEEYIVKVENPSLNYYSGPGFDFSINGHITDKGSYAIIEESNGWGKLKSGAGWIYLEDAYKTTTNASLSSSELGKMYNLYYFDQLCHSDCQGYLEDIDGDGTDELIHWGYSGGYVVFSYVNGKLVDNILNFPGESQMKTPLLSGYELLNKCRDKAAEYGFSFNRNFVRDYSAMVGYVDTAGGTLNLRDEPSANSRVITEIPYGTFFNVYNQVDENGNKVVYYNGGWYYITVTVNNTSYSGWISADYAYVVDTSI